MGQGSEDMLLGTGRRWVGAAALVVGLLAAGPARAHLRVTEPTPRGDQLKQGPCGADGPRGAVVHTFAPGQTITVHWNEFVDHPGHYRISFDADGEDGFADPASFADVAGGPGVLIDGIPDREGGGDYEQEVTLPDVVCDRCTLQVIQVMTDKAPYGDGNDIYYQCVDLVLSPDAEAEATTAAASDDGGCGCRGDASGIGALALLGLLGLLGRRRRAGAATRLSEPRSS